MAISDVARVFGLRTSAIRYYEQIGILPRPMRKNGQRRYDDNALFRLAVVQRARETGFTLEEIRALLDLGGPGKASCRDVRKIASHHLEHIRSKIADLVKLEKLLAGTIAKCSGKVAPDCPVIDVLADRV